MADTAWRLKRDRVTWRRVEGEIVALDLQRSEYLSFTPTGCVVWEALHEGATEQQLLEEVLVRFDVDEATATADLEVFLQDLRERDLLEVG